MREREECRSDRYGSMLMLVVLLLCAAMSIDAAGSQTYSKDAVSREVSVLVSPPVQLGGKDAVSREVSVLVSPPVQLGGKDAVSREVSVLVSPPAQLGAKDAVSREVSALTSPPFQLVAGDGISREVSLVNLTPEVDPDGDGIMTFTGGGPCAFPPAGICEDNCALLYNPDQRDGDANAAGDICDVPKVIRVVPGDNAIDVPPWANVTLNFSEPMDLATLTDVDGDGSPGTFRVLIDGVPVAGTVSVTATGLGAVFDPAVDLPVDTLVQVDLSAGAVDLQGVAAVRFASWFRTSMTNDPALRGLDEQEDQTGSLAGERFGSAVAAAGDVNGDGIGDWLVGAPGFDSPGLEDRGRALLFLGSADGAMRDQPAVIFLGSTRKEFAGVSVAGGEDVNFDGTPDLLIGAEQFEEGGGGAFGAGRAYLIYFDPTAYPHLGEPGHPPYEVVLSNAASAVWAGKAVGDRAGHAVDLAPDLNEPRDGKAELLIGAPRADNGGKVGCGEAYLVYGRSSFSGGYDLGQVAAAGSDGLDGTLYLGESSGDGLGWSVDASTDFDGDGTPDVALGAPFHDAAGFAPVLDAGMAAIDIGWIGPTFGRGVIEVDGIGSAGARDGIVIVGDQSGQNLGYAVSLSSDHDGDGRGELLIGAPHSDVDGSVDAGEAFWVHGVALDETVPRGLGPADFRDPAGYGATFQGTQAGELLGTSVGATESKTSVGSSDLLLGAPGHAADAGAAYVDVASSAESVATTTRTC